MMALAFLLINIYGKIWWNELYVVYLRRKGVEKGFSIHRITVKDTCNTTEIMAVQMTSFPVSAKWYRWIFILLGFMIVCQIIAALQEPWLNHFSQQLEAGEITEDVCTQKGIHVILFCNILLILSTIALTIVGLKILAELRSKGLSAIYPCWLLITICGWLFCFGQVGLSFVRYEHFSFEKSDDLYHFINMYNTCAFALYALATLSTGLMLIVKCHGRIRLAGMLLMMLVVVQAFVPMFDLSFSPFLSFFITVFPFVLLTICMALFFSKEEYRDTL